MKPTPPKVTQSSILKAVETALLPGVRSATVLQHPKLTVVATRRGKPTKRDKYDELVLTIGRPNHRSSAFIKKCLKAGESFPVHRAWLQWFPEKRKQRNSPRHSVR